MTTALALAGWIAASAFVLYWPARYSARLDRQHERNPR